MTRQLYVQVLGLAVNNKSQRIGWYIDENKLPFKELVPLPVEMLVTEIALSWVEDKQVIVT